MKRIITLIAAAGLTAVALSGCAAGADNDAAAKAGKPLAEAITSSLANHTDFGTAPKDNKTAITFDAEGKSVIIVMTDPEPSAETTMIAANLKVAEGTKITQSGISGKQWCITVTADSGKAVYTQDGLAKSAAGCAADGSAS